ncbi:3-dehydroquinate synthase [Alkalihalobacillus pseudalcaliphilus]|uniref:3-dehydroquinate synthase n=1 Tax=Alkalihalobacillus pseudalcaliphilus TaxID=79884 RepID=UPI00064DF689|nr:3-dehydroquinate synthase [Alkalihalobacillus pseudalcaliphilus]KMK76438.1 3-dehydroquinate synthase [Alkalihalobacillus pseudalcaliphilus]
MSTVQVKTFSKDYSVYIQADISEEVLSYVRTFAKQPTAIYVITDSTVAPLYLNKIKQSLNTHYRLVEAVIEAGEHSKSFQEYERLLTIALENQLDRHALIIALGGGVVGDIAGFVAATYLRGIRFIQIPTTLLAQDSSVGGKVAINHPLGKNMIGAFHQPEAVLYDPKFLQTLPEKEWRSGFAEVFKHGLIVDKNFYQWLKQHVSNLSELPLAFIEEMLERSISIKAKIVASDEKEAGVRAYLNLGHTLGHAIEKELGYGKVTHGEAVAIGIIFALKMSEERFRTNLDIEGFIQWLQLLGYETKIPAGLHVPSLMNTMRKDKKTDNGIIRMVLLKGIGEVTVEEIEDEKIIKMLEKMLRE